MSAELFGSRINGNSIELLALEHASETPPAQSVKSVADLKETAKGGIFEGKDGSHLRNEPLVYFSYSFFSPELAYCRTAYFKITVRVVFLIVLLMWATLPIYWGSLYHSAELTGNLKGWIIDRDMSHIGPAIVQSFLSSPTSGLGSIGWTQVSVADVGDDQSIAQAVIHESVWVAVIISANASSTLTAARQNGNVSYDPTSAITVYYNQARNELANGNYLVPLTTNLLINSTQTYATGSAQRYFAAIQQGEGGAVNATALHLIAQAPQTMSPAVSWKMVNLRPYTAPVAQAVTLVGQIYIIIFAFMTTMAHSSARDIIQRYLKFTSYLYLRLIYPLVAYFPLSLCYAMVSLPFNLPFASSHSKAGGFFLFFTYAYLSMAALGLALEAMITLLGPRFIPFFLVLLIIVNVSTTALPLELQPSVYAYGAGFPFYNMQQAIRTIVFNTESHLGVNLAVLFAWILMSLGTISIFTWFVRRREVRKRWGPPPDNSSTGTFGGIGLHRNIPIAIVTTPNDRSYAGRSGSGFSFGYGHGQGSGTNIQNIYGGTRTPSSIESGPGGEVRFIPISVSGGVEAEDGVAALWVKEMFGRVFRRRGIAGEGGQSQGQQMCKEECCRNPKDLKGKEKVEDGGAGASAHGHSDTKVQAQSQVTESQGQTNAYSSNHDGDKTAHVSQRSPSSSFEKDPDEKHGSTSVSIAAIWKNGRVSPKDE